MSHLIFIFKSGTFNNEIKTSNVNAKILSY